MRLGRRRAAPTADPVAAYVRELEVHLRRRGRVRGRITGEVRGHLEEGIEALARERNLPRSVAAAETIARFGSAEELAGQFNATPKRRSEASRRLAVLWIAWLGAMGMGSATVWAAFDGSAGAGRSHGQATVARTHGPACASPGARGTRTHISVVPPRHCRRARS
jgi:hypothetical protein